MVVIPVGGIHHDERYYPNPGTYMRLFFLRKTPTDLKFCILFLLPLSFSSSSLTAVCLCLSLPQSLSVSYLSLSSLTSPISLMSSTPITSPRSPRLRLAPTPSLVSIYLSLSVFFLPLSISSSSLPAVCLCLSLSQSLSPIAQMTSTPTTSPRSPRLG